MPITFYPHEGELDASKLEEKIDSLLEAAERYKAVVLETGSKVSADPAGARKRIAPSDITYAYNWEEIAKTLSEIRNLPEANSVAKATKADRLSRLAEIYEVLRAAKMPKLEAVRLALINEATQLRRGGSAQVA